MKSLVGFLCVIFVSVLLCTSTEEGDTCLQFGIKGTCKKVQHCSQAIASINTTGKAKLQRCSFDGFDEVVCCPESAPIKEEKTNNTPHFGEQRINTVQKRISEEQCEIYKKKYGNLKYEVEAQIQKRAVTNDNPDKFKVFPILGGKTTFIAQFPHMGAIGYEEDESTGILDFQRCGASLISPRWVLTAAHCLICANCPPVKKVRFGVINITATNLANDMDVKDYIVHPDYNSTTKHNDIGLLELKSEIRMAGNIKPGCLYTKPDDPPELIITGWGKTDLLLNKQALMLQMGFINPVPINQCNTTIKNANPFSSKTIIHSQICAISESDSCSGDSGGPLQIRRVDGIFPIVGVISYGIGCGTPVPGIYTRVYSYLDWIEPIVWPKRIED